MITHATPQKHDLKYDKRQRVFVLPIVVHHLDSSVEATPLRISRDQMAVLAVQVERQFHQVCEVGE
ncbi:hypothetical protein ABZ419_21840 [Streptomyces cinnamoneus]|uniref:hypothetical protein n=1 Tax=Streptomyces cinnamoneus TaxID=53446 RepID=UPI0033F7CE80